jgi:hypothetical protein
MSYSRSPIWNFVDAAPTLKTTCPRCNNVGDFRLAWDGETLFFGMGWTWRKAVYHCPICPYVQEVPVKSVQQYLG